MLPDEPTLKAAQRGDDAAFARLVAPYRRELRAHCYRMSGSIHDADDLLQDSLLRAWKGLPGFEQRADLRTWLYRVTTHACLDALEKRSARLLPAELGPAAGPNDAMGPPRLEPIWLEPCPASLYESAEPSPEARIGQRESVTLAFLVALQLLPARQRAVLILRDVLGWQASECGELLEISVAAVNSALQRARETLASRAPALRAEPRALDDAETRALLSRYVHAWERADVDALVALLHEDATLAMPPLAEWLAGAAAIRASIAAMVFAPAGPGAFRLLRTEANGRPAFAAYQRDRASGELRAASLHVLDVRDGRIAAITAFLDPSLLAAFELPGRLDDR
ncbi:MAG TPA: sigma-70 family RNA polymerase sigma factor [Polyangia bacterium]|nr:sigma-70 family RNA polymerase sigma factor [Polyangia bacterium]